MTADPPVGPVGLREGSFEGLSSLDPEVYGRWVRIAFGIGVIGYLTGIIVGWLVEPELWRYRIPEVPLLALSLTGLILGRRAATRGWALVFVAGAFLETHLFFFGYGIEGPTLLLGPAFVLGAGFLFGERALGITLLLSVGIVVAAGISAGPPGFTPREIERVIYLFVSELGVALLTLNGVRALVASMGRADQARRRAEDLVLHAPDGILVLDGRNRILHANPTAERYFRRPLDDLRGEEFDRLRHASEGGAGPVDWGRGTTVPVLVRAVDAEGRLRLLEATSRRLPDDQDDVRTQVILRNVTERVRADARERELAEERRTTQRLEALGVMAGGMAHDFNNLLTVIRGSAELLKLGPGDDREELLDEILVAQARGATLIGHLLAFARKDVAVPEPRRVSDDLNRGRGEFEGLLADGHTLQLDLRANRWILADARQLLQVVRELVGNAAKALPAGGRIAVGTDDVAGPDDGTDSPWVRITVADDGVGMPPDVAERMFDPFFTTRPFGEGSGLGLAMVHGIVKQAGGIIEVESSPGEGTTVNLLWPAAPSPDERPLTVPDTASA